MITVVSGSPRSGTSLAMQMLAAGGIPPLTDGLRQADIDNPNGYWEWEPVKLLAQQPAAIAQAEGKAVKVISSLLGTLPAGFTYRVLFMERPVAEMLASQQEMLRRRGAQGGAVSPEAMAAALTAHLRQTGAWLDQQQHLPALRVRYHDLLASPLAEAQRIEQFLGAGLDTAAMAGCVDRSLYRQRAISDRQ